MKKPENADLHALVVGVFLVCLILMPFIALFKYIAFDW